MNRFLLLSAFLWSALSSMAQNEYFTVVMFSDVHVDESRECLTTSQFRYFVEDVIKMGEADGKQFRFSKAPEGYVPKADLILFLGDMDKDSQSSTGNGNSYQTVTKAFADAGIPFLDELGNHDVVPDFWSGQNADKGLTGGTTGGARCNDIAFDVVNSHIASAQCHGISDVTRFTDGTNHLQAQPYAFLFRGVRFYMGQAYWFQKPYTMKSFFGVYTGLDKYYKPDAVISSLDAYATDHADEPSIWTQHYPFVFGSDCDRWWLDQNDVGKTILPSDNESSQYPGTESIYTSSEGKAKAKLRKEALAAIIKKTKNPVHFSGHVHEYGRHTFKGITDYSLASAARHAGEALIVLCKEDEGFVECQRVKFAVEETPDAVTAAPSAVPSPASTAVYTLSGRRTHSSFPGIYIVNQQKTIRGLR